MEYSTTNAFNKKKPANKYCRLTVGLIEENYL